MTAKLRAVELVARSTPHWGEYVGPCETCPVCYHELPNPEHYFCCNHDGCEVCGLAPGLCDHTPADLRDQYEAVHGPGTWKG